MKPLWAISHAGVSVFGDTAARESATLGEVTQIRSLVPSGGISSSVVSALSGMKSHLFVSTLEKPDNTIGQNKLVFPCVDEGKCRHTKYEASLIFLLRPALFTVKPALFQKSSHTWWKFCVACLCAVTSRGEEGLSLCPLCSEPFPACVIVLATEQQLCL